MFRKIIKGVESEGDIHKSPDVDPYTNINPDAFSTETDRTRTRVPFKTKSNWDAEDLRSIYTEEAVRESTHLEGERSSAFSNLGLALLVFLIVAGLGVFFLSPRGGEPSTLALNASSATLDSAVNGDGPDDEAAAVKEEKNPYILTPPKATFLEDEPEPSFDEPGSIGEFIARSTINGVFMRGKKSRITINGTTYRVGEVVSDDFGLVFIGFHRDRERAVFQGPDDLYYMMSIQK